MKRPAGFSDVPKPKVIPLAISGIELLEIYQLLGRVKLFFEVHKIVVAQSGLSSASESDLVWP